MKRRTQQICLALILVLSLAADCTPSDKDFVVSLAMSWLAEHAVDAAQYGLLGSSGNPEVDAVLDVRSVVDNINKADKLAEEGRAKGDLYKVYDAIKLRPGDWTYQTSLSTMLLSTGELGGYADWQKQANQTWQDQGGRQQQMYINQQIDELTRIKDANSTSGQWTSPQQKDLVYTELSRTYAERFALTGDPNDKALSEAYSKFPE